MQNVNELPDWMLSKATKEKRARALRRKQRTAQIMLAVLLAAAFAGAGYGNAQMVALGYSA